MKNPSDERPVTKVVLTAKKFIVVLGILCLVGGFILCVNEGVLVGLGAILTGVCLFLIGGFIAGYATNFYLNMSLFFAFALLYPEFELMLFFVIPVKIKYLAFADLVLFLISILVLPWSYKIAAVVSLCNVAIFFWDDFIGEIKRLVRNHEMKKRFKR